MPNDLFVASLVAATFLSGAVFNANSASNNLFVTSLVAAMFHNGAVLVAKSYYSFDTYIAHSHLLIIISQVQRDINMTHFIFLRQAHAPTYYVHVLTIPAPNVRKRHERKKEKGETRIHDLRY